MRTGVLLMAYGSPDSLDEVEPYLVEIRGGKPIRPGLVSDLTDRYRRVGGRTPLLAITRAQAEAVRRELGTSFPVAIGMKHWRPTIHDGAADLVAGGVDHVVGIALAPHYSAISIGGYASRAVAAFAESNVTFEMVESWYDEPGFVELVATNVRRALGEWPAASTRVFFTAHSLPERILADGDPYLDQLIASAKLVADAAGVGEHVFAFQSASTTGEPWLGPDIGAALSAFAAEGGTRAVICPIGFVTDHLEILFDLDIEASEHARSLGIELRRVRSPNDDPALASVLARIVRRIADRATR